MARQYHSPSSASYECDRAWAYAYVDKLREPEIDYALIESGELTAVPNPTRSDQCSYKQRGAALGTAGHDIFAEYFRGHEVDWLSTLPARIAGAGVHNYPHPHDCAMHVERAIGTVKLDQPDSRKPQFALREGGVLWVGYRDLVVQASAKVLRDLGVTSPRGVVLFDHKFTSDIDKYALTPSRLYDDVQCNLYVIDVCRAYGLREVPCRWVYHQTKDAREGKFRSLPIDVTVPLARAREIVGRAAERARHLDTLDSSANAAPNTDVCCKYSGRPGEIGCPYHVSKGGPCDVRLTMGALLRSAKKETEKQMAISAETQAKFAAAKAAREAAAGGAPADAKAETPAPAARKPRTPKARPAPEPEVEAPAAPAATSDERVARLIALQQSLAEKQAALDVAAGERDAVLDEMREALA